MNTKTITLDNRPVQGIIERIIEWYLIQTGSVGFLISKYDDYKVITISKVEDSDDQ